MSCFKKICSERAGKSCRAGYKLKLSWQSLIVSLFSSHFPLLLKILTLTAGRTYPSTNNAHRKTLIENDHFYVQAVFWISSQTGRRKKKKRERNCWRLSHQSHPTNACPKSINSNIFFSDSIWKLSSIHFARFSFHSLLPFFNKINPYFYHSRKDSEESNQTSSL